MFYVFDLVFLVLGLYGLYVIGGHALAKLRRSFGVNTGDYTIMVTNGTGTTRLIAPNQGYDWPFETEKKVMDKSLSQSTSFGVVTATWDYDYDKRCHTSERPISWDKDELADLIASLEKTHPEASEDVAVAQLYAGLEKLKHPLRFLKNVKFSVKARVPSERPNSVENLLATARKHVSLATSVSALDVKLTQAEIVNLVCAHTIAKAAKPRHPAYLA